MTTSEAFLQSKTAKKLYTHISDLPIIDYHCHLSPKEIYDDIPFSNIGEMWLANDHYKWRIMRTFGIPEEYITGKTTSFEEKFLAFAKVMSQAAGSPLYHWCKMELEMYFDIQMPLNVDNAAAIFRETSAKITAEKISPRKLIEKSKVTYIATTDDAVDDLSYHKKLYDDENFTTKVCPSFRTDNLLMIQRDNYCEYIDKLSNIAGIKIDSFANFKQAIENRLDYFVKNGCKFTDVGIPLFPNEKASEADAKAIFGQVLDGKKCSDSQLNKFIYYMYVYLASEYKKRELVMQMHLAVKRNANSKLYADLGADCGGDCVGDVIPTANIIALLDEINSNSGLPQTIVYTLNSAMYDTLISAIGCFRNVRIGSAWWFQDNKNGIIKQIKTFAENANLANFLGMLTDSRSFLSYARHDYFRRILCSVIGEWIDLGEFADDKNAIELVENIAYYNIEGLIKQ